MSRSRTAILGFFVIIGFITLCFTAVIFIPRFAVDYSKNYVIYFQGELTGLQVGSPVTVRGIKVGQVSRLNLQYNEQKRTFNVPVYIHFLKRRSKKFANHALIRKLIKGGLRAELHVQNIITGNAAIELEFRSGSTGHIVLQKNPRYLQIPSVPDNEQQANFRSSINAAKEMFDSITKLVQSPKLTKAFNSITTAANSTTTLANNINDQVPGVTNSFTESLQEFKHSAYSVRTLSELLSRHPESLLKGKNASARR